MYHPPRHNPERESPYPLIDWRALNEEQYRLGVRAEYGEDGESLAGFKNLRLALIRTTEDPGVEVLLG